MRGPVVVTLVSALAVQAHAKPGELERARAALGSLGYAEARGLLETALTQGGHSRDELLEIYALRGEVAAVLDGPDAGEREFRKLLALDPKHAPPARETPTFMAPFENARKWVQSAGSLSVEHVPATASADAPSFAVVVRAVSDPLAMVAGARVFHRMRGAADFTPTPSPSLQQNVSAPPSASEYFVEVVDRWGNVITRFGSAEAPLTVAVVAAEPRAPSGPPQRWYKSRAAWALFGLGLVGVAAGAALFAEAALAVSSAHAATLRSDYVSAYDRAVAFDSAGGALAGVGGVLTITGIGILIQRAQRPRAAVMAGAP